MRGASWPTRRDWTRPQRRRGSRSEPISMRPAMALRDEHLAVLHERARELEIPRYRMLARDELIEAIEERDGEEQPETAERGEAAESGFERPRRAPEPAAEEAAAPGTEAEPEEGGGEETGSEVVTGVLDRMPQGYGFLRLSGLHESEGDVYVSASQIRRCELRPGDEVSGPARPPRRGERHRALVRIEAVNGQSPEEGRSDAFDRLTPVAPHRRIPLEPEGEDVLVRAADLLAPLAFGQRVLVRAAPRSGRTTLLRGVARAIAVVPDAPGIVVLLVDERPEEVTEW